ncbi:uncharacterized protein LOC110928412 [Helianthus annuus]|uniref:uncharacterized protein LOC110928412 n=1 Tax=Helianthus annuus TaxID=4232 RepID=UPI000B8EEFB8|nr:uncharacterized protein LOC110928412 [Helianthus annuus]
MAVPVKQRQQSYRNLASREKEEDPRLFLKEESAKTKDSSEASVVDSSEALVDSFTDASAFVGHISQSPRDIQDDSDEEFVPDTQEQHYDEDEDVAVQENPVNQNEAALERRGKLKRENWTPKQEEALAKAYVHFTLNRKKGNQQKADGFWKQVLNHFNQTVGGSNPTHHQVRSKWLAMQTKLNTFNGLYHQADRLRPSGSDDAFVMKQALKDYKSKEGYDFTHITAWEVVRTNQKWSSVPLLGEESSGSSQKRKSSDSGNYRADTPNVEVSSRFGIPDINEDSSPRRQKRKEKKDKGRLQETKIQEI